MDKGCPLEMAIRLVIDAKLNYAAACNAVSLKNHLIFLVVSNLTHEQVETILIHKSLTVSEYAGQLLKGMKEVAVKPHRSVSKMF